MGERRHGSSGDAVMDAARSSAKRVNRTGGVRSGILEP
nr:hypothetical protein [Kibdelosporangium sp. MJ126-NF4]